MTSWIPGCPNLRWTVRQQTMLRIPFLLFPASRALLPLLPARIMFVDRQENTINCTAKEKFDELDVDEHGSNLNYKTWLQ